jgi:hypothetical protein
MITKHANVEGISFGHLQPSAITEQPGIQARFVSVTAALREEQRKTASSKELSEKVDDFLYASCIMMHAAESALINQETGEPVLTRVGEPVKGWFEQYKNASGRETVRWVSPDGIKPYRNGNLDIFPESELVSAHKEWIGKPLCKDHVSNTIDGIRGVIVDTYYDPKFKRVHALFALDRKNYPELARKVEAGYATNVSMGTGVGRSVCAECQNVATAANEFCNHVRSRTHYGEINLDLNPIELSIVVTGADPLAKIRKIVASLNTYQSQVSALKKIKGAPLEALAAIEDDITSTIEKTEPASEVAAQILDKVKDLSIYDNSDRMEGRTKLIGEISASIKERNDALSILDKNDLRETVNALRYHGAEKEVVNILQEEFDRRISGVSPVSATTSDGTPDSSMSTLNTSIAPQSNSEDLHLESPTPFSERMPGLQMMASIMPINDEKVLLKLEKDVESLSNRLASIKNNWNNLNSSLPKTLVGADTGDCMSFGEISKRSAMRRKAYLLGTEEPKEYPQMGDQEKLRMQDKHMVGDELDTKVDNPDQKVKEMLHRAELSERRAKRAAALQSLAADGSALKDSAGKTVAVVDSVGKVVKVDGNKLKGPMAADDGKAEAEEDLKEAKAAMIDQLNILREAAKKKTLMKGLSPKDKKAKEKEDFLKKMKDSKSKGKKDEKDMKDSKPKKKAYLLGTEEPHEYPLMGDQEKLRMQDKHMVGDELDTKAENPDQKLKEMLHRARLSAVLTKSAQVANSKWTLLADGKPVFTVTAGRAYNKYLGEDSDVPGKTWGELFQTREYGRKLLAEAKAGNLGKIAEELDKAAPVAAPELGPEMPEELAPEADKAAPMPMTDAVPTSDAALKDRVMSALEKVEEVVADLRSAVMGDEEGVDNVDVDMQATASLDRGMFEAQASLLAIASELRYLSEEADLTDSDVRLAARAAVRDARLAQIEAMERIAEYEEAKEDDCGDMMLDDGDLKEVRDEVEGAIDGHEKGVHEEISEELGEIEEKVEDLAEDEAELQEALEALRQELEELEHSEKEDDAKDGAAPAAPVADAADAALAARAEMRKKMIQRAASADSLISKNTLLESAHKGENRTVDVGTAVSDKLNVVHDNIDTQEKALAAVKVAAAGIATAVRQGKLRDSDLDGLAAVAAVDAEAVKYFREYYGKVDSTFAKEMSEDFKKQASEDTIGVRYSRAYNLALEAQGKGFISVGRQALDQFAESLVGSSDSNFEATKRIVAQLKSPVVKTAGMPQMGVVDETSSGEVKVASQSVNVRDPVQLGKALFG